MRMVINLVKQPSSQHGYGRLQVRMVINLVKQPLLSTWLWEVTSKNGYKSSKAAPPLNMAMGGYK